MDDMKKMMDKYTKQGLLSSQLFYIAFAFTSIFCSGLSPALGQSLVSFNSPSDMGLLAKGNTSPQAAIMAPPLYLAATNQLLFNWKVSPQHLANTPLTFHLYEQQELAQMQGRQKPIYAKTLQEQKLLLDAHELGLQPYRKYAFWVLPATATAEDWQSQLADHHQVFTYLPDCTPPKWITATVVENTLEVNWERPNVEEAQISYLLAYRELFNNEIGGTWIKEKVEGINSHIISDLKEGKKYEVRVRKICGELAQEEGNQSEWIIADPVSLPWLNRGQEIACEQFTSAALTGNDYGILLTWNGPPADPFIYNYRVRYRNVTLNQTDWVELRIVQGTEYQLDNLTGNHTYEVEMHLVVLGSQGNPDYDCPWMNLGTAIAGIPSDGGGGVLPPPDDSLEVELPDFNCGDPFDLPAVDESTNLSNAQVGDYFFIGGFPLKLLEVTGGSGVFSGQGLVPLPFSQKVVRVEFSGVRVNANYEIFSGSVNAVADSPANYPNIPLEPINLGGPFCVEVPDSNGFDENGLWLATGLPWNPQGFGPGGTYDQQPPYPGYVDGNPFDPNYDPNGYNSEGIHVETGTLYNPDGCSQLGLDVNGQPCNPSGGGPYYWLNDPPDDPPTEGGIELANNVADWIRPMIVNALSRLLTEAQDSTASQRGQCDGIRTNMQGLLSDLGHGRPFIFGPGDEYFAEGMHKKFSEKPQALGAFLDRNPATETLEEKHIDLYDCDEHLFIFLDWERIIIEQQEAGAITECETDLKDRISRFSPEDVQQYSDSLAMADWVFNQVDQKVSEILQGVVGDLGMIPMYQKYQKPALENFENVLPFQPFKSSAPNYTQMWAGLDVRLSGDKRIEDIAFEFLQGWRYVGGVHRVHYLEVIAKGRKEEGTSGMLSSANAQLLPIEVSKLVAGRNYTLYLDNIVFTPTGASLDVFFILEIPSSGDRLVFELENFDFGPTGGNFADEGSRLSLTTDLNIRLSNAAQLHLLGNKRTYIQWDCEGFAGMGVDAEIEFCRNYLLPVDPATMEVIEPDTINAKAYFRAEMPAWGEFVAELTVDPFAVTQAPEVKWQIQGAQLDMSDTQNAPNLHFPENYNSPFISGSSVSKLWKGFYLQSLTATLPNKFDDSDGSKTVGVEKVIIDDMGFTGKAFVSNLLDLSQGNLGGWAFSVDTFALSITTNKLTGAHFNGLLHLPIMGSKNGGDEITPEQCVGYTAMMETGGGYSFAVNPLGNYYASLWRADLTINSGSQIVITSNPDGFNATALLNGNISIDGDFGNGKGLEIPDITFQQVGLSTEAPYFSAGTWGFPAAIGANFAGFGIMVGLDGVSNNQEEVTLHFGAGLRLNAEQGSDSNDSGGAQLKADGSMRLIGELQYVNGRQRWKYKDFKLDAFSIDGSFSVIERLRGSLVFYEDDPLYGKGFRGLLDVKFKGVGVGLQAVAQFGKMPDYKYFLVDVLATFEDGIDMGGLQLLGIGGGCYNHMTQSPPVALPEGTSGPPSLPGLGESLSGITYTPSATTGLGFKASAVLATPVKEAFNCNVTLGMEMNSGGGLSNIYFKGHGRFMSDADPTAPPPTEESVNTEAKPPIEAVVSAFVSIQYDFNNRVLDGNFATYLNVGDGLITGTMNNAGKMGQVVLHFAPNEWYVNIGTPSERCGVKLSVPGLGDLIQLRTYLDVGTKVPQMPPLPAYVSEITGASSMGASPGLRNSGRGFAFGADLSIDTGDLSFLVFYGRFSAGLGFDLMLMDYGATTQCSNTNNGKIGINGWYASGQAWAYVQGEIGLQAKVFGQVKRFSILSLGAGVALQAKLPNPFWAQGNVGGYYSVLGGLFEGKCNFEITVGETCEVVGELPSIEIEVIESLSPFDSTEVGTLTHPTVSFSLPLTEAYELDGIQHSFELEYARLERADGTVIPGNIELDDYGTFLKFQPLFELPQRTDFVFKVKVNILKNGSVTDSDEESVSFNTGFRETIIPLSNVVASYPANGQYNFYPHENPDGTGYILLDMGQPELFANVPSDTDLTILVYKPDGGLAWFTKTINYDPVARKIAFPLRPNLMPNGQLVELQLALVSKSICLDCLAGGLGFGDDSNNGGPAPRPNLNGSGTGNNNTGNTGTGLGNTSGETAGNIDPETNTYYTPEPKILYRSFFRVSQYDTFHEKMQAFVAQHSSTHQSLKLSAQTAAGFELFDPMEAGSFGEEEALVGIKADLLANHWYSGVMLPGLYAQFPDYAGDFDPQPTLRALETFDEDLRAAVSIGYDPTQATVLITEEDFQTGDLSRYDDMKAQIDYNSTYLSSLDWSDLKRQIKDYVRDHVFDPIDPIYLEMELEKRIQFFYEPLPQLMKDIHDDKIAYPHPTPGTYPIQLTYQLPGTGQVTSSFSMDLNY